MQRLRVAVLVLGLAFESSCGSEESGAAREAPASAATASELLARVDALEREGDLEGALTLAKTAIGEGGGRDATIAAVKIALLLGRDDEAIGMLEPLVAAEPGDAIAQYDLGLAHHHRNDYNGARRGYLAALRADPTLADARFNLALLCWTRGIQGEGRHHVEKFVEAFPSDPRGDELKAMLAGTPPKGELPPPKASSGPAPSPG